VGGENDLGLEIGKLVRRVLALNKGALMTPFLTRNHTSSQLSTNNTSMIGSRAFFRRTSMVILSLTTPSTKINTERSTRLRKTSAGREHSSYDRMQGDSKN